MIHRNLFTFHNVPITTSAVALADAMIDTIYIPQCLYYNQEELNIDITDKEIYIPQCLYYNQSPRRPFRLVYNLHSTMSLLQREKRSLDANAYYIYIPQCLYYNCTLTIKYCAVLKFTFHNVSITTDLLLLLKLFLILFTFHNVSITTERQDKKAQCSYYIYIPQCLYYNAFTFTSRSIVVYLHSTMSLLQPRQPERGPLA